jgi:hypothetical protein
MSHMFGRIEGVDDRDKPGRDGARDKRGQGMQDSKQDLP